MPGLSTFGGKGVHNIQTVNLVDTHPAAPLPPKVDNPDIGSIENIPFN